MLPALALCLVLLLPAVARADEASHRKAAETLLNVMGIESMLNQSVDQMVAAQTQQNPQIAQFQPQLKTFLSKYISWASMKDDMAKLYMEQFTEADLTELVKFYQTPLGKKTVEKMPTIMAKSAEMGQKRVQEHLPELQAAIQAEAATKKAP